MKIQFMPQHTARVFLLAALGSSWLTSACAVGELEDHEQLLFDESARVEQAATTSGARAIAVTPHPLEVIANLRGPLNRGAEGCNVIANNTSGRSVSVDAVGESHDTTSSCSPRPATDILMNSDWTVNATGTGAPGAGNTIYAYGRTSTGTVVTQLVVDWMKVERPRGGQGWLVGVRDHRNSSTPMAVKFLPSGEPINVYVGLNRVAARAGGHRVAFYDVGFRGDASHKRATLYAWSGDPDLEDVCDERSIVEVRQSSTQRQTGPASFTPVEYVAGFRFHEDVDHSDIYSLVADVQAIGYHSNLSCEPDRRWPSSGMCYCDGLECGEVVTRRSFRSLWPLRVDYEAVVGASDAPRLCATYHGSAIPPSTYLTVSRSASSDPDPDPEPPPPPSPDVYWGCSEWGVCRSGYYPSGRSNTLHPSATENCPANPAPGTGSFQCTELVGQASIVACQSSCPSGYSLVQSHSGYSGCGASSAVTCRRN